MLSKKRMLAAAAVPAAAAAVIGMAPAASAVAAPPARPAVTTVAAAGCHHHHHYHHQQLRVRMLPETVLIVPVRAGSFAVTMTGPVSGTGTAVAVPGDGYRITSGSRTIQVRLFERAPGRGVFTLRGQPGDLRADGTYRHDGRTLVLTGTAPSVQAVPCLHWPHGPSVTF